MEIGPTATIAERKYVAWNRAAKAVLIILFFAMVGVITANFDLTDFQAFFDRHQQLAFLVSLLAVFFAGMALIPTIPLILVIAVLLGPIPATLISALGNTLSALVHYQIGKQMGDLLSFHKRKANLPFKLGMLPVDSPLFLLLGRAVPGGPKGLSFICGAYSVPFLQYLWTTFLTNLIGAALVAYGSELLQALLSMTG